jgi:hypothetical protein
MMSLSHKGGLVLLPFHHQIRRLSCMDQSAGCVRWHSRMAAAQSKHRRDPKQLAASIFQNCLRSCRVPCRVVWRSIAVCAGRPCWW